MTIEVLRDLGLAFAVVLVLIYVLVVGWFRSFKMPLVIMAPIPLTLIGILPGHALSGAFFTAPSVIGLIALAGIVVRNSILLVDFIQLAEARGSPLRDAVLEAGAVRFRPIALTAAAVVVGGFVMVTDPIFQGLAVALMSGAVVATLLTMIVVPILYWELRRREVMASRHRTGAGRGLIRNRWAGVAEDMQHVPATPRRSGCLELRANELDGLDRRCAPRTASTPAP